MFDLKKFNLTRTNLIFVVKKGLEPPLIISNVTPLFNHDSFYESHVYQFRHLTICTHFSVAAIPFFQVGPPCSSTIEPRYQNEI